MSQSHKNTPWAGLAGAEKRGDGGATMPRASASAAAAANKALSSVDGGPRGLEGGVYLPAAARAVEAAVGEE